VKARRATGEIKPINKRRRASIAAGDVVVVQPKSAASVALTVNIITRENELCMLTGDRTGHVLIWSIDALFKQLGTMRLDENVLQCNLAEYNPKRKIQVSYRYLFQENEFQDSSKSINMETSVCKPVESSFSHTVIKSTFDEKLIQDARIRRQQGETRRKLMEKRQQGKVRAKNGMVSFPLIYIVKCHSDDVNFVDYDPDLDITLSSSADGYIRVFKSFETCVGDIQLSSTTKADPFLWTLEVNVDHKNALKRKCAQELLGKVQSEEITFETNIQIQTQTELPEKEKSCLQMLLNNNTGKWEDSKSDSKTIKYENLESENSTRKKMLIEPIDTAPSEMIRQLMKEKKIKSKVQILKMKVERKRDPVLVSQNLDSIKIHVNPTAIGKINSNPTSSIDKIDSIINGIPLPCIVPQVVKDIVGTKKNPKMLKKMKIPIKQASIRRVSQATEKYRQREQFVQKCNFRRRKNGNIGSYSKNEILRLRLAFDKIDENDSKTVTCEELVDNFDSLLEGFTNDDVTELFDKLDQDRSGHITFPEMLRMFLPAASRSDIKDMVFFCDQTILSTNQPVRKPKPQMSELQEMELRELFRIYDKDRSGAVSLVEMHEILNGRSYNANDKFLNDDQLLFTLEDSEQVCKSFEIDIARDITEDQFIRIMFDFQSID